MPRLRFLLIATVWTLIASTTVLSQSVEPPSDVMKVVGRYDKAIFKQDAAAFKDLLSDDYVLIDWTGEVINKSQMVSMARSGDTKFEIAKSENNQFRTYGDTVIWNGDWTEKGVLKGEPISKKGRFTTVLAKQDGKWKVVSDQVTEIAPQAECPWQYEAGEWYFKDDGGNAEEVVWELVDGDALVGRWIDKDGNKSTELVGWRPHEKAMVAHGFGPNGSYWDIKFTTVTESTLKGKGTVRYPDGSSMTGTYTMTKESPGVMSTTFVGTVDGEKVTRKGHFTRKKQ